MALARFYFMQDLLVIYYDGNLQYSRTARPALVGPIIYASSALGHGLRQSYAMVLRILRCSPATATRFAGASGRAAFVGLFGVTPSIFDATSLHRRWGRVDLCLRVTL